MEGGGPNVEFGLGKFALPAGWVIEVQKCISNDTIAIFPRQVNSNNNGGGGVHNVMPAIIRFGVIILSYCNVDGDI